MPGLINRYFMLCEARDLALEAGDFDLFLDTAVHIGNEYAVDSLSGAAEAMQRAARKIHGNAASKLLAEKALAMCRAAAGKEKYEAAGNLAEAARDAARNAHDPELIQQAVAAMKDVKTRKSQHVAAPETE